MSVIYKIDDSESDDDYRDNLIYYFSLWKNMFLLNRDG